MKTPHVSIILPTYKRAAFVGTAIKSVIAQDYVEWELIIIDDGLTLQAVNLIEQFIAADERIIYIRNSENLGIQKSLNRGLREARGEYIARIDDDDEWMDTHKLSQQVGFLEKNTKYVLVGTNAIITDEDGRSMGTYDLPQQDQILRSRMLSKNCFIHSSIMARKQEMLEAGGYTETQSVRHIEDYALWLKLGLIGKCANLPITSVRLTIHPDSMTSKNRIIQALRMRRLIRSYKGLYPGFWVTRAILGLRIIGFRALSVIPLPASTLYTIQKIYKGY